MRRLLPLLLAVAALGAAPPLASAAPDLVVLTGGAHVDAGQTYHDVVVIDGPVAVDGHVTGSLVAVAGTVRVSGLVDGDVVAVANRATVGPGGVVGGDLRYGDETPVIARGGQVAGQVKDEGWAAYDGAPWTAVGRLVLWLAVSISTLALGLLLLWLAPGTAARSVEVFRRRSAHAALLGLVVFLGLPMAAVVLVATFVGLPLGIAVLLGLVPLGAVGYVAGANVIGALIAARAAPIPAFLAGWGVLRLAALAPGVGIPAGAVMVALGLGSLLLAGWEARGRADAPAEEEPTWSAA